MMCKLQNKIIILKNRFLNFYRNYDEDFEDDDNDDEEVTKKKFVNNAISPPQRLASESNIKKIDDLQDELKRWKD